MFALFSLLSAYLKCMCLSSSVDKIKKKYQEARIGFGVQATKGV